MNNRRNGGRVLPQHGYTINEKIRDEELRVINHDGENLGSISRSEALSLSESLGLDLVQINKDSNGVVTAKIMDFGKFLYEKKKQQNESKKKTKTVDLKEVKMRPNIDDGDFSMKVGRAVKFLEEGDHVKITLQFRGRELSLKSTLGPALFDRVINEVREKISGLVVEYQKESGVGAMWTRIMVGKKK